MPTDAFTDPGALVTDFHSAILRYIGAQPQLRARLAYKRSPQSVCGRRLCYRVVGRLDRWGFSLPVKPNAIGVHRAGHVLDLLLAPVFEREVELVAHLVAHNPADADPAGLGQSFQPCRN